MNIQSIQQNFISAYRSTNTYEQTYIFNMMTDDQIEQNDDTSKLRIIQPKENLPTDQLINFSEPIHDYRHSKPKFRHKAKSKMRRRKLRRSQPLDLKNVVLETQNVASNLRDNRDQTIANQPRRHIALIIILCLIAVAAPILCLVCIRYIAKKHRAWDSFSGSSSPDVNQENCVYPDSCMYCMKGPSNSSTGLESNYTPMSRDTLRSALKTRSKRKRSRLKFVKKLRRKPTPPLKSCKFNDPDLKDLEGKLVCVLRNECTDCKCCKCGETVDNRKRRFRFFSRKKKILCNDVKCDENKIQRIINDSGIRN